MVKMHLKRLKKVSVFQKGLIFFHQPEREHSLHPFFIVYGLLCIFFKMLKTFLQQKGNKYRNIDIV